MKNILIGLSLICLSTAAPLTSYDQRQEGQLNVKVDLDNFVIVVARPSSSSSGALDLLGSMASLFDDAKNAVPKTPAGDQTPSDEADLDDKSKSLDDVTMDKESTLAATTKPKEEAVIVLVQTEADNKTDSKSLAVDVARTLRNLKDADEKSKSLSFNKFKLVHSAEHPESLKLIGDAIENCGPGRSYDKFGICKQD